MTGYLDWTIIPVNVGPYLIVGTDGDLYVRHLPLVGPITLTGRGVSIEGKIQVDFSAEFDATGTGVIWMPVTITDTIDGVKSLSDNSEGPVFAERARWRGARREHTRMGL